MRLISSRYNIHVCKQSCKVQCSPGEPANQEEHWHIHLLLNHLHMAALYRTAIWHAKLQGTAHPYRNAAPISFYTTSPPTGSSRYKRLPLKLRGVLPQGIAKLNKPLHIQNADRK
jgi:hypothetical protein